MRRRPRDPLVQKAVRSALRKLHKDDPAWPFRVSEKVGTPKMPDLSFDPYRLLEEVHRRHFAEFPLPHLWFRVQPWLACINTAEGVINVHQIFNSPATPREVLDMLFTHEYIHLEIAPREINGRMTSHPPEFWVRERELSPNRDVAWRWIYENFWGLLAPNGEVEAIYVKNKEWLRSMRTRNAWANECNLPEGWEADMWWN